MNKAFRNLMTVLLLQSPVSALACGIPNLIDLTDARFADFIFVGTVQSYTAANSGSNPSLSRPRFEVIVDDMILGDVSGYQQPDGAVPVVWRSSVGPGQRAFSSTTRYMFAVIDRSLPSSNMQPRADSQSAVLQSGSLEVLEIDCAASFFFRAEDYRGRAIQDAFRNGRDAQDRWQRLADESPTDFVVPENGPKIFVGPFIGPSDF